MLHVQGSYASEIPARSRQRRITLKKYPPALLLALFFLSLVLLVVCFAEFFAPNHYASQNLASRLKPPSWLGGPAQTFLGTDELGRDVLSRLLYGARFSVVVALLATLIGAVVGGVIGFVAVHLGRWIDEGVMMLVDVQASLPVMILALAVLAFFGNSFVLFIAVLGLNGWEVCARLTRGLVLQAKAHNYAAAARALGASPLRLYARHILPNIAGPLIVQFTLNFPQTILLETSLSFLGLGIQPPLTSLGQMLGAGRSHLILAWWIAVFPGVVIFLLTLSVSIVGDWWRDRLDPALRSQTN
jgi:peptide/nickel transport system permease protein